MSYGIERAENLLSTTDKELTALEGQMADLLGPPPPKTNPRPASADDHERFVLGILTAVYRQQPGAWIPLTQIADYRTDRATYRAAQHAVTALARRHAVETIRVAFDQRRVLLIRLPHNDIVDIDEVELRANAALAAVGHRVEIIPARLVHSNFTSIIIEHDGRALAVYQQHRRHTVALTKITP